uniref:Uncharacterized protein n=1 Tax=Moniliophthora roreri TaxID=221103 RepID=A0A0W0GEW8_MONRR
MDSPSASASSSSSSNPSLNELLEDTLHTSPGTSFSSGDQSMYTISDDSNQSSADLINSEGEPTHDVLESFIQCDLVHEKVVEVDLFIQEVSHVLEGELSDRERTVLQNIVESQNFQDLLDEYCTEMTKEVDRYSSFMAIVNYTIGEMVQEGITANDLDYLTCVNEPIFLRGSMSDKKPDVLGVTWMSIVGRLERPGEEEGIDAEAVSLAVDEAVLQSPEIPFMWSDVLSFTEFSCVNFPPLGSVISTDSEVTEGQSDSCRGCGNTRCARESSSSSPEKSPALSPSTSSCIGGIGARYFCAKRARTHSLSDDELDLPCRPPKRGKPKEEQLPHDALQCASYAVEIFNHGGIRTHVIGTFLTDD